MARQRKKPAPEPAGPLGLQSLSDLAGDAANPRKISKESAEALVVDRTVAKIGSAAIAKSIRKGRIAKQFVAVTCHYDILEWLEPDWVLDMASGQLARGCLYRRPDIKLSIAPVHRSAWRLFRRHHYLNHDICMGAKCFCAFLGEESVGFSSWVNRMTRGRKQRHLYT